MSKSFIVRVVSVIVALVLLVGLAACGSTPASTTDTSNSSAAQTEKNEAVATKEEVTIKFISDVPDRKSGLGLLEQTNLDAYLKDNSNVKLETEFLTNDTYADKLKAYAASGQMPDVWQANVNPTYKLTVKQGINLELDPKKFDSFGFVPGALDAFKIDGKLYGVPKNCDFYVLYYNKDLFDKNGVKVPETFQNLLDASKAFRAKGIAPCAMNGKDKWTLYGLYQLLAMRESGTSEIILNATAGKIPFSKEDSLVKAANDMKALSEAKFFQDSFTSADYGAARNLFVQGKAAMYLMGSWEMGMGADENIPDAVKNSIGAVKFPVIDGGKGVADDLALWYGGGYAVNSSSNVKDAAIGLVEYLVKPDVYAKNAWQMNICIPPMKYDQYFTGKENQLQKDLTSVLVSAKSTSGALWGDVADPAFGEIIKDQCQALAAGIETPEKFLEALDKGAAKVAAKK